MTQINYSKGGDDFKPWPESVYDFIIKKVEQGTSKNENPQLTLTLEAVDGPQAGKSMKDWRSLLPQAAFRIEALIEATGCPQVDTGQVGDPTEKFPKGKPIMSFDTDDLVGRYFRATLSHRIYNGKTQTDLSDECPSAFAPPGMTGKAEGAEAASGGAEAPAAAAPPSAAGAPAVGRRPRPAPAGTQG